MLSFFCLTLSPSFSPTHSHSVFLVIFVLLHWRGSIFSLVQHKNCWVIMFVCFGFFKNKKAPNKIRGKVSKLGPNSQTFRKRERMSQRIDILWEGSNTVNRHLLLLFLILYLDSSCWNRNVISISLPHFSRELRFCRLYPILRFLTRSRGKENFPII